VAVIPKKAMFGLVPATFALLQCGERCAEQYKEPELGRAYEKAAFRTQHAVAIAKDPLLYSKAAQLPSPSYF
jgi:hypothetical protein